MEVVLVEPARMPRGTDSPGELTVDLERVALDDFGGVLASVVEALIGAGMDKAVAWAGTRRVVELSLGSSSRRPPRAGDDPRLAGLGADAVCARAWMTLVVGSWRAALGLAADELAERASGSWTPTTEPHSCDDGHVLGLGRIMRPRSAGLGRCAVMQGLGGRRSGPCRCWSGVVQEYRDA